MFNRLKQNHYISSVRRDGYKLEKVPEQLQTPEICMEAVKQCSDALQYVINQTPKICITAIENDPHALKYVRDKTYDICLAAVSLDGTVIIHVPEKLYTAELWLTVYKSEFGKSLNVQHVKKRIIGCLYYDQTSRFYNIPVNLNTIIFWYIS